MPENCKMPCCSKCGKEFDEFDMLAEFNISTRIGYGSVHDGEFLDLHLCCECMDKLIADCAVSPVSE